MRTNLCFMLAVGLLLGACTGLQQFPDTPGEAETGQGGVFGPTLEKFDPEFRKAVKDVYAAADDPEQQKTIRNQLIEERLAVIDIYFAEFVRGLAKEDTQTDFGVAVVGVGVGGAGALVTETASQILSAVSGGLAGAKAAYDKSVLYDQALSALIAQMKASRKSIAARIFSNWTNSIEDYPLWLARRDLDAYQFAGSLPGAVVATAADAKVKEQQADAIILAPITPESVTKEAFKAREDIEKAIDGLEPAKASALLVVIEKEFPAITKLFVEAQYPADVRAGDTDGKKAKVLLKRIAVETADSPKNIKRWQTAIEKL